MRLPWNRDKKNESIARKARRRISQLQPGIETLEARELMAGDLDIDLFGVQIAYSSADGALHIEGGEAADTIVVRKLSDGTFVDLISPEEGLKRTKIEGELKQIRIDGGGGNDFIELPDLSLEQGIQVVGGAGADTVVAAVDSVFQDQTLVDDFFQIGDKADYADRVRTELTRVFRDEYGFVVSWNGETAGDTGEAVYFTAVAATALAAETFELGGGASLDRTNQELADLLSTLLHEGWSTPDGLGRSYPIRHPLEIDFVKSDVKVPLEAATASEALEASLSAKKVEYKKELVPLRQSPLAHDAFGQILTAAHYSYASSGTTAEVKELARDLVQKYSEFLVENQWRLTTYTSGDQWLGELYNASGDKKDNKGPDTYMLFPHERYALQNVGARMGLVTSHWNIWQGMETTLTQEAADGVAALAGGALDAILRAANISLPYDISIGPSRWNLPHIKGSLDISISDSTRNNAVKNFEDVIREGVRAYNLAENQGADLLGLAVNRVLDLLPEAIGPDSWRTVITTAVQEILPWISGQGWIEAGTFIGSLEALKAQNPSTVGYAVWTFAAEMEARPEMADLLRPFVKEYYYNFLRPIAGNDHPLWAWLANDGGRTAEHLDRFESEGDPRRWDDYAWHRGVDAFYKRDDASGGEKIQSRLDYVALDALHAKGAPLGLTGVALSWRDKLADAADAALAGLVNSIKAEWANPSSDLVDLADRLMHQLGLGVDRIAGILADVESDLGKIAQALAQGVTQDLDQIAKALLSASDNVAEVADALYHHTEGLGKEFSKLTRALSDVEPGDLIVALSNLGATPSTIAKLLAAEAKVDIPKIANLLHSKLELGLNEIAGILKQELVPDFGKLAEVLHDQVSGDLRELAQVLSNQGADLRQVADALDDHLKVGYRKVADAIYHGVTKDLRKIAGVLDDEGASLRQVADALDDQLKVGYRKVADAIYHGVTKDLRKIAGVLDDEGASLRQVADALDDQLKVGYRK
ncbi:MAG: hypothetical protein RIC55_13930, partial [Pirellulaceae bacterium]